MCQAMLGAIRGKLGDAEARAEQAIRWMNTSKLSWAGSAVLTTLAYARASRGDWRGADDALDLLLRPGFVFNQPNPKSFSVYRHLVRIYAGLDVDESAGDDLRGVRNVDQPDYFSVMQASFQVELAFALGRRCADESALRVLRRAGQSDLVFTPAWPFLVPRMEGLALFMEGKSAEAEAAFEKAVRLATRLSADTELCRALIDFGAMLCSRRAHDERGAQLLRRARAMSRGRFFEGLAERVLIRSRLF
jgi:tetratricopeptide (TPR) repeat protein